jgi:hypothetical protein
MPAQTNCTEKITICAAPNLPPYSCFASALALLNVWDLFGSTRNLCDYTPLAPLKPAKPAAARYYFDTKTATAVLLLFLTIHRNLKKKIPII